MLEHEINDTKWTASV